MRIFVLFLIVFIGGCSLTSDVELLKLRNDITELREEVKKNNQLDEQNWLLDLYQRKQLELLNKERERSRS